MSQDSESQPVLRDYAVWMANGEAQTHRAESITKAARHVARNTEFRVVAVVEMSVLMKPNPASGPPLLVAVVANHGKAQS